MNLNPLTFVGFHTILSLIALVSGVVVLIGMLTASRSPAWTAIFLVTAIATSATGYGFPADKVLPSHIVGAISLVVLLMAALALYRFHLAGSWRWLFVVGVAVAVYLDAFVLVVQLFRKIPTLMALAPTQSEPPFAI